MSNQFGKKLSVFIRSALKEDIGRGDITTKLLIPARHTSKANLIVKEKAVICGLKIFEETIRLLDKNARFRFSFKDGQKVSAKTVLGNITANTRALLTAERVALNFLCRLSGIATLTNLFCERTKPYHVKILDTRKTTPGLRALERYAVKMGGGENHRYDLSKMVLIKDNHKAAVTKKISLQNAIEHAKRKTNKLVEAEVGNLKELSDALKGNPDIILLDNMRYNDIKKAVNIRRKWRSGRPKKSCPLYEISGGVSLQNVRRFAKSGVERISVGALTHSSKAVDFSLEFLSS